MSTNLAWIFFRPGLYFLATLGVWLAVMLVAIKVGVPKQPVLAAGIVLICAYLAVGRPDWFWSDLRVQRMRRVMGDLGVTLLYLTFGILFAWLMLTDPFVSPR